MTGPAVPGTDTNEDDKSNNDPGVDDKKVVQTGKDEEQGPNNEGEFTE